MKTLTAGLDLIHRGFAVLPLHNVEPDGSCSCGNPKCHSTGKHPRTVHGAHDGTKSKQTFADWCATWPAMNLGITTGEISNCWVLDVDPRHGGDRTLVELVKQHGPIGPTLCAMTGGLGDHYYFTFNARLERGPGSQKLGPGLDVKTTGGLVVAPPSMHASGNRYEWRTDTEGEPLPAPVWLVELVVSKVAPAPSTPIAAPMSGRWGTDWETRVKRAVAYVDRMPEAVSGQDGHGALLRVALAAVRGFELPDSAALEVLRYYSARCLPPWSEKEIQHKLDTAKRSDRVPPGWALEGRS